MARIDVLKEEIAEAREKRLGASIAILFGGLIYFIMIHDSPVREEAQTMIQMFMLFLIVLMFGVGCLVHLDNRIKKLKKELETIK